MDHLGKGSGLAMAGLISAAAAGATALGAGAVVNETVVAVGAGFACALLPLGWLLGERFDRIRARSERDSLTGVFNRSFLARCFVRLSEQARKRGKCISVTLIDLNDFKRINDTYGHRGGDQVLVQLAKALQTCADRGEIVGRWGGDEFVLLSPYAVRGAEPPLHRLIEERLERLSASENKTISAAVGTAVFPEDGRTIDELLQAADRMMYAHKHRCKQEEAIERLQA